MIQYLLRFSLLLSLFWLTFVGKANDSTILADLELKARQTYRTHIDSSIYFATEITRFDSIANKNQYAFALNWLGICWMGKGVADSADYFYQKAIYFSTKHAIEDIKSKAFLNRSINYFQQGNYENALKMSFDALESFTTSGDTLGAAHAAYNIANAFNRLARYEEAKTYYWKAEKTYQNINPKWSLANVYNALGTLYFGTDAFDSASYYFTESIAIKVAGGAEIYCASEYSNLATIYKEQGNFKLAKQYYLKSFTAASKRGNTDLRVQSLHNLGLLYLKSNHTDSSIYYLQKSISLLPQIDDMEETKNLYLLYAKALANNRQFDTAYFYLQKGTTINDSLKNDEVQKEALALHQKFQVAEKNEKLAHQKVAIMKQKEKLWIQLLIIIGLVILVGIIGFIFFYRKKKQILQTQNKLNSERSRIAMDLHDHVGAELTVVTSNLDSRIYETTYSVEKENLESVVEQVRRISEILRETVWSIRTETITVDQLEKRVQNFCTRLLASNSLKLKLKSNCEDLKLAPQIALTSYRVCQEAVTNSYKYSKGTSIKIEIIKLNAKILFSVTDNGQGFNINQATETGFGLENMQQRVLNASGQYAIISNANGTSVKWEFELG